MARRTSGRKLQPAVETLTFQLPTGNVLGTIDLSQCASIVNRRFYRQGLNWYVAGFTVSSSSGVTGGLSISKIQNTWVTGGAWEKTMRAWLKQQNEAVAEAGAQSAVAKYRDFKIFLDDDHFSAGGSGNMLPIDTDGTQYNTGEWQYSRIVVPNDTTPGNTVEYALKMYGADTATVKGIVDGYQQSRAYPHSPDPVSPATYQSFLSEMFDVGDDSVDIINNAQNENDDLPYDQTNYPGSVGNANGLQYIDLAYITPTTVGGKTRLAGSNFPCGLIRVNSSLNIPQDDAAILQVHMVPGTHRGYMCEKMEDF